MMAQELLMMQLRLTNLITIFIQFLLRNIDMSNFDSLKKSLEFAPSLLLNVKFLPQDVFAQLDSIDVSKACGPDLITGFLLKRGAEVLASSLSYLFNKSLCSAPCRGIGLLPMLFPSLNVMINQ